MDCCHDRIHADLAHIRASLVQLHRKVNQIMSEQSDLDAEVQQIQTDVSGLQTASQAIKDEIAALEAQVAAGQPVDLTGLKAAVAALDTATSDVESIPPAPPAP